MSCSIPLIAVKTSSIPELVGDFAHLINPRDSLSLANKIKEVFENYDKNLILAENGRNHIEKQFNWEKDIQTISGCNLRKYKASKRMLTFDFNQFNLKDKNGIMLDIGCGEGRHVFGTMQNYKDFFCIGLDMDEVISIVAQEGFEFFSIYFK